MKFSCYHCGAEEYGFIAGKRDIRFECYGYDKRILKCFQCGLVQLWPRWTPTELDKFYAEYSKKEDFPGQKRKVKISKYLAKYVKAGELALEVGCGHGDNLAYLANKGIRVIGIDKESNSDYMDYNPEEKQDLIYAIHLLEHLPDPRHFIVWILRNLTDTGRFVLEIPCLDDPLLKLYDSKAYKKFCWYPYHLFFYNKKTATALFDQYPGLKMKFILRQEYGLLNHLRWLFLRRPGNLNFHIPLLDNLYKFILTSCGCGDTLVIVGEQRV